MTKFTRNLPNRRTLSVAVAIFDGVVLADFAIPSEIFGRVRLEDGRKGYAVKVCGVGPEVRTEHCTILPAYTLRALRRADIVVLPGIDDLAQGFPESLLRAVRAAAKRGARIASICTGAFALAETGLLDGLKATTHWMAAPELARRHPAIRVDPNVLYIDNGNILTSAGAAAGHDLCLHIVRRDFGATIAAQTARFAVVPLERSGGQAQFILHKPPSAGGSLQPLLGWIEQNLDKDLGVDALAAFEATSIRTLHRKFAEQTGTTPARWVLAARLYRARELLETSVLSIEQVATEAGFGSATALREGLRKAVGTTPAAYRKTFRSNATPTATP